MASTFGGLKGSTWQRLLRWMGLMNPEVGHQASGSGSSSSDAGVMLNDDRSMSLSAVWACSNLVTNSVTSLPFDWYQQTEDGRDLLEDDHYISRLFYRQPNRYMKPRDLRKALTLQMALWNNGYAHIDWQDYGSAGQRAVAITPLHPGRIAVFRDEHGLTYHYSTETGVHVFAAENILHLKGVTIEGVVGLNRLDYAGQTLGLSVAADRYAAKQFANGGRPGGVLTVDKILTGDQRTQLKQIYSNMSAGADNANSLWVLEGGTQYNTIDATPDAMQMIQSRQHQLSEVARFFGVPDVLIGAAADKSSWPASFEQQVLAFLTFTLQAYIDEWEAECHHKLVRPADKRAISCDHEVGGFIRMDSTAKANYLGSLVQNGLMTRNEGRARHLNLPKVEGADELTAQVNLTPLEELEKVVSNAQQI